MSDHAWVHENLDAYLAGGLPSDERERLEQHVAGCDACVSALAAAQKLDRTLVSLFAPVRPDAALEDRAIQKLRTARPRRRSLALRFVGAAAAVIVMGGLGVVVQALAAEGGLPFSGMERTASTNSLKQIVLAFFDAKEDYLVKENYDAFIPKSPADELGVEGKKRFDVSPVDEATPGQAQGQIRRFWMNDQASDLTPYKIDVTSVPGAVNPKEVVGVMDGDKKAPPVKPFAAGGIGNTEWAESDRLVRDLGESEDRKAGGTDGLMGMMKKPLGALLGDAGGGRGKAEKLGESDGEYYRTPDVLVKVPETRTGSLMLGAGINSDKGAVGSLALDGKSKGANPLAGKDLSNFYSGVLPEQKADKGYHKPGSDGPTVRYEAQASILPPTEGKDKAVEEAESRLERMRSLATRGATSKEDLESVTKDLQNRASAQKPVQAQTDLEKKPSRVPDVIIVGAPVTQDKVIKKQPELPIDPARKIIRTGELEFEIDSFDNSVATVATLINAVKGGFVATVNSDKLPNGKVRGSVVVRMPPQFLDKFLLDLRKELVKVGELKTQRIGSQDVTKQYTDIESRLRAARTMEERFIAIIKNGKGEVKDLIAAERELGIWRTKIEEMEGEIRYYNNQIGLSTLTISLTEKEIQAAAAVVITERVGMRIEVEDVEKAHLDALKAVAEEKGRITKSELKQHPAGQLEAVLQVEVAPEKAKKLRDVFKKLGLVTFNDVQRVQQAVGGGKVGEFEGKLKQADVQINVTLYDTANIQPRESVTMLIATDDVQASYRALQAAVVKAKGQIRVGQLREPEKITINAEFNFDVPSPEKPTIDAILAKLGVILSSTDVQVPINETATDRKFGYRLVLRNLATVPARESSVQSIAVSDVPTIFREIQDAVLAAKGTVQTRQLTEQDKVNIRADLSFDVPKADRQAFDKVLAKLGDVLSSSSAQAGANEITTDRKFGYRLTLLNLASIRPREIITLELVTNDVRANFQEVRDAVKQAKGVLYLDRLIEDTPQQTQGKLDFDVASADKATIEKLLAKSGSVLKRSSNQANLNETASDRKVGFRVLLHSIASVPPREKVTLVLKVDDVNAKAAKLAQQVRDAKGQASRPRITQSAREMNASLVFDVPLASEDMILGLCKDAGRVLDESQTQNAQVPDNELATAQITVTLSGPRQIIASDESFWTPIQRSLEITFQAFAWSVTVVILGLGVVLPWVVAIWVCVKIVRKMRGKAAA